MCRIRALFCVSVSRFSDLDLVERGNVHTLDVILDLFDLLLQLIDGDLVILDDARQLQFVDSVRERDQLGSAQ